MMSKIDSKAPPFGASGSIDASSSPERSLRPQHRVAVCGCSVWWIGAVSAVLLAVLVLAPWHASTANREGDSPGRHSRGTKQSSTVGGSHHGTAREYHWDGSSHREWDPTDVQGVDSTFCNIPRVDASTLSRDEFASLYLEKKPVILTHATDTTRATELVRRAHVLQKHGNMSVTLSTANKNSYVKRDVVLREYLSHESYMGPQPLNRSGADSWYMFGDHVSGAWQDVWAAYEQPRPYMFGRYGASLSFGIGPAGSGVPFHTHGHVFNEVFFGKKRWWIQRPTRNTTDGAPLTDEGPRFDPDESSLWWLDTVRPTYTNDEVSELLECVCGPGDLLYIPSLWHHATLNIGEVVFMAAFV